MSTCPEKRVEGGIIIGYVAEKVAEPKEPENDKPKKTAKTKTKGEG